MTRTRLIMLMVLLFAASEGFAQQSSFSDFEAYVAAMEGRWIGEITWIADWPGLGDRGDKVTSYSENNIVAEGRVLMGSFYGGNGTSRLIVVFDAASGEIRQIGADSGGSASTCILSKQDGYWASKCSGSLADGTATEADVRLTISDNGNTHTWTGTITVGGEPVDPLNDVWRRVGQ